MTLLWVSNASMSIDLCAHIAYNEEVGAEILTQLLGLHLLLPVTQPTQPAGVDQCYSAAVVSARI